VYWIALSLDGAGMEFMKTPPVINKIVVKQAISQAELIRAKRGSLVIQYARIAATAKM
jgi:hypothetical protein